MTFLKGRQILWLLVPATFVVAFLWDSSVQEKPSFVEADNNPDYYLVETSTLEFNTDGQRVRKFTSEKTSHFKDIMQTRLEKPVFKMMTPEQNWQVSADFAVSNELSEQLDLDGDVTIKMNSSDERPPMTLSMPVLTVDFATQTAFTDAEVELTNTIFKQTAKGMSADLKSNTIEFKSQVVSEEL
ncbi:LPS export ABC transporter periplasmic protein LptC [Kangiella marina]|uniref:LPS export ABC transporter periplasmic protein LptC n=1 Tax=Kangiella marina TaxID=1079178 RepID=A0ABP8IM42_9GAMM